MSARRDDGPDPTLLLHLKLDTPGVPRGATCAVERPGLDSRRNPRRQRVGVRLCAQPATVVIGARPYCAECAAPLLRRRAS